MVHSDKGGILNDNSSSGFLAVRRKRSQKIYSLLILVLKIKVVQNVNRMSEIVFSVCQYVNMSVCQNATFQLRYQNESCSKCHKDVRQSVCQYVNITVNMSECYFSA